MLCPQGGDGPPPRYRAPDIAWRPRRRNVQPCQSSKRQVNQWQTDRDGEKDGDRQRKEFWHCYLQPALQRPNERNNEMKRGTYERRKDARRQIGTDRDPRGNFDRDRGLWLEGSHTQTSSTVARQADRDF